MLVLWTHVFHSLAQEVRHIDACYNTTVPNIKRSKPHVAYGSWTAMPLPDPRNAQINSQPIWASSTELVFSQLILSRNISYSFFTMRFLSLLFVFSQLALLAQCLRNVTVDDTDPQIQYTGDWSRSAETNLNYNSSHALTMNATSEAVFQFTGTLWLFLNVWLRK